MAKKTKDNPMLCPRCKASNLQKRILTMPGDEEEIIWRCLKCRYSEYDNPHLNDPDLGDGSRDRW